MADTFDVNGIAGMVESAMRDGMFEAMEHLLGHSVQRAPIEEGILRASATVEVVREGDEIVGAVGYNTPYARKQHEDLSLQHPNGGEAKFLERPAVEQASAMQAILGDAVRQALS